MPDTNEIEDRGEMETLLLFLPPGMKEAIRLRAAGDRTNMNKVIRDAIRSHLPETREYNE